MDEHREVALALRAHNIGLWEPMWRDLGPLARQIGHSVFEIESFVASYRAQLESRLTAVPLSQIETAFLPTGDAEIDTLLGGGMPTRCLTEICGASSVGKTGFALQLCLSAQTENATGRTNSVYISTEDNLFIRRLSQLQHHFPEASLDNVLTYKVGEYPMQLVKLVEHQLPRICRKHNVNLVVIDSIALFHDWINTPDQNLFIETCRNLRRLAHTANAAVVVTNQIRDRMAKRFDRSVEDNDLYLENQERFLTGWTAKPFVWGSDDAPSRLAPALGYTWTREIDQRLALKNEYGQRSLEVVFSRFAPPDRLSVELGGPGLTAISDTG